MSQTKTLIFDLGGVIVPLDFPNLYRELSSHCGLPVNEIPKRIAETGLVIDLEMGKISGDDFSERIGRLLGFSLPREDFRRLWSTLFPPHTLIPEELLLSLKRRYRMLMLSNTNSMHFEMIRQSYPLTAHFDDYVLSYQVGTMKPAPGIYEAAIARAMASPRECLFIDDIAVNVEAARLAGLNAVQFLSFDQLTKELDSLGIEWRWQAS